MLNMLNQYDKENIFSKILQNKIPCNKIYEDDYVLAFHDIAPAAKIHVIIIPKAQYCSFHDFAQYESSQNVALFFKTIRSIAESLGVDEGGYRILFNHGKNANQTVPHFHVHLLAGEHLGSITHKK